MKRKILSLVLSIFVAATVFTGCAESVDSNSNKENDTNDALELKLALYSKVLGTWENYDVSYAPIINKADVVIFANDSISLDDKKYDFNPLTDIYFEEEVPEDRRWLGESFYFYINDKYYSVILDDANPTDWVKEGELRISFPFIEESGTWNSVPFDFTKVSSGDIENPGTDLDISVVGDWKYTISAGNTKTTFSINNDGTFTFSKNSDVTNGTYSLNGNKVTFSFEKGGQEIEDTFTISGSEDAITLTLVESKTVTGGQESTGTALSNMLLSFYTIIDTSITLSK